VLTVALSFAGACTPFFDTSLTEYVTLDAGFDAGGGDVAWRDDSGFDLEVFPDAAEPDIYRADVLDSDASELDSDASELDSDASELDSDASELDSDASELDSDASELDIDASELDIDASELDIGDVDNEEDVDDGHTCSCDDPAFLPRPEGLCLYGQVSRGIRCEDPEGCCYWRAPHDAVRTCTIGCNRIN
jgi:hypothetical protein